MKEEPANLITKNESGIEIQRFDNCTIRWIDSKTLEIAAPNRKWIMDLQFTYAQVPDDNPTHTMPRVARKRGGGYEFL